jgi:hypothetical protein
VKQPRGKLCATLDFILAVCIWAMGWILGVTAIQGVVDTISAEGLSLWATAGSLLIYCLLIAMAHVMVRYGKL